MAETLWRRSMQEWLLRQNIDRFRQQLNLATHQGQRETLQQLLLQEEDALHRLLKAGIVSTPAELREEARLLIKAARNEIDIRAKRRLAGRAFALAQQAEMTERAASAGATPSARTPGSRPDQFRRWRDRANELRMIADQARLPETQDTLRRVAANYDRLADDAEAKLTNVRRPSKDSS